MDNIVGFELSKKLVYELTKRNLKISSSESCTGGMFAKMITDVAGSSAVLDEAYITYANKAKEKILGVRHETLERYGAVSSHTASEMVSGLKRVSGADICVCFTGIAGPGGGTPEKPVGLVYVGLIINDEKEILKLNLEGVRDSVRCSACNTVIEHILKKLKK